MAFDLSSTVTEVHIFDARAGAVQSLFVRDATPQEQLAFERERVSQQSGKIVNRSRQARLKFGCRLLDHAEAADTPEASGYGFRQGDRWVPLGPEVTEEDLVGLVDREAARKAYARQFGEQWARWIGQLEPWKLFLLVKAPAHVERAAMVVLEGAADYRPPEVVDAEAEEDLDDEGDIEEDVDEGN